MLESIALISAIFRNESQSDLHQCKTSRHVKTPCSSWEMHNLQQVQVLVAVSGPSLLRNAGAVAAGDQTGEVQQMQEQTQSGRLLGGWLILDDGTTKHNQKLIQTIFTSSEKCKTYRRRWRCFRSRWGRLMQEMLHLRPVSNSGSPADFIWLIWVSTITTNNNLVGGGSSKKHHQHPDAISFDSKNIARIANAVQVTICLLVSTSVY